MKNIRACYIKYRLEAKAGDRTYAYGEGTFYALPYPIYPSTGEHDYRHCESCQAVHKKIIGLLKKKVKKFPNCCDSHKKLLTLKEFNRSDFKDADKQCADKVIFTYQHILNKQSSPIWKVEIGKYIDEAIDSFGNFPDGYGIPFLFDDYMSFVRQLIDNNKNIRKDVVDYVSSKFDMLYIEKEKKDPIADLCKIYDDWLSLVPFNLPFLKDVRDNFRNRSPLIIYEGEASDNNIQQYLITDNQLLAFLGKLTKELLVDVGEHIAVLGDEEVYSFYREFVRQELLLSNQLLDKEKKNYPFALYIERWMKNQEDYFDKLHKLNLIQTNKSEDAYPNDSYKESLHRVNDLKRYIEFNNIGILINPHHKERSLQQVFKLFWRNTSFDFNAEVNNGRGPVDFKVSKGSQDKTIIEFKLVSNSMLEQNLLNQGHIYAQSNGTTNVIVVFFYFSSEEKERMEYILKKHHMTNLENYIKIDCTRHVSASKARTAIEKGDGNRVI